MSGMRLQLCEQTPRSHRPTPAHKPHFHSRRRGESSSMAPVHRDEHRTEAIECLAGNVGRHTCFPGR